VLDELRSGAIHLTGLFLLDRYLNDENAEELLTEARGMSRRELEKMLAIRFPRPDVPSTIEALDGAAGGATGATEGSHREAPSGPSPWFSCPGTDAGAARGSSHPGDFRSRVEPLSAGRYRHSIAYVFTSSEVNRYSSAIVANHEESVLFPRAHGAVSRHHSAAATALESTTRRAPRPVPAPAPLTSSTLRAGPTLRSRRLCFRRRSRFIRGSE
jgi:hypothetical protein